MTGETTTLGGSTTGFVTTGWVVVTTGDFIGDVGYDTCCCIITYGFICCFNAILISSCIDLMILASVYFIYLPS